MAIVATLQDHVLNSFFLLFKIQFPDDVDGKKIIICML